MRRRGRSGNLAALSKSGRPPAAGSAQQLKEKADFARGSRAPCYKDYPGALEEGVVFSSRIVTFPLTGFADGATRHRARLRWDILSSSPIARRQGPFAHRFPDREGRPSSVATDPFFGLLGMSGGHASPGVKCAILSVLSKLNSKAALPNQRRCARQWAEIRTKTASRPLLRARAFSRRAVSTTDLRPMP